MTKKYDIGYKKPPRKHQFKKGQSGNPKGRPKKEQLCTAEIWDKISNEIVTVKESGNSFKITKNEAILRRLSALAMSGNLQATKQILQLNEKSSSKMRQKKLLKTKEIKFATAIEAAEAYKELVKDL